MDDLIKAISQHSHFRGRAELAELEAAMQGMMEQQAYILDLLNDIISKIES